jgi:NAD(P)-dependent dehydrogenase (short-subunit alcohol dehydrogenase family)
VAALQGRVALITGAARGIGLATARGLANAGAHVVIHDRVADAAEAAVLELRGFGSAATPLVRDLIDKDAPSRMAEALAAADLAPDILVLNASAEMREIWSDISDEALALQTEVNLHATARLLRRFLPTMLARGFGRIVAIGSVQETRPNADCFYYAATKAAQTNMILNLARTLRAPDVTCNIVQPGAIATDRNRAVLARAEYADAVRERIPLGRIGGPEDCAGAVLFLCLPEGGYVNGAVLAVDGGARL